MNIGPDREPRPIALRDVVTRTVAVVAVLSLCLIAWRLRDALSVAFGSILLAVGLRGLADWLKAHTGLPVSAALALVIGTIAGLFAVVFWVFEANIAAQYDELVQKIPQSLHTVLVAIRTTPLGRELLSQIQVGALSSATISAPHFMAVVFGAASSVLTYGLIMIFGGVFLAIDPNRYHHGLLRLIPPSRRDRAASFLARLTQALRRWLAGRLVVMAAVGILASLGLWALGIEAPFALGLTGALLSFIPFVGALLATVPAVLMAFVQAPLFAVWVGLLFWAVHFVEGTFITPYVQDEAVDVPPVISIFSTVVFTVLLGPVGILLAGPLTLVVMVAVEALYIEDVLGERFERPQRRLFKSRSSPG